MDLTNRYNTLYDQSWEALLQNQATLDAYLNGQYDNRFGITLLLRLDGPIIDQIQHFQEAQKAIEPEQYYYPRSDIHVTVLSIISCYDGFQLEQIHPDAYVEVIQRVVHQIQPFPLRFSGITASQSAVMVQGFYDRETLDTFRNGLREGFKETRLQQSIDRRYAIETAHSTISRFRQPFNQPESFLALLNRYRNHDFGTMEVKSA